MRCFGDSCRRIYPRLRRAILQFYDVGNSHGFKVFTNMIVMKAIGFVHLLMCILLRSVCSLTKAPESSAAIPRIKTKKTAFNILGHSTVRRLIRETKMNFCSDLELLTLQVRNFTRLWLWWHKLSSHRWYILYAAD